MRSQTNRKAITISALLTAFVLTLAGGGLLLSNQLAASNTGPAQVELPVSSGTAADSALPPGAEAAGLAVQPADTDAVTAAYEAQLQAANQALQEAYAQINALQASQNQPVSGVGVRFEHEGGHDHD
jgi:hypothetical protein